MDIGLCEDSTVEYKRLEKLIGKNAKLHEIAEECVAFANAQGGYLVCGIADGEIAPPPNQVVNIEDVNRIVSSLSGICNAAFSVLVAQQNNL